MVRTQILQHSKKFLVMLVIPLIMSLAGCTHLAIEDCGGEVLGDNKPRIRSSHFRMFLADLPAASDRFLSYAAMSSLAYAEDQDCGTPLEKRKVSPQDREKLEQILNVKGWKEVRDPRWIPVCEDDVGLYLRVWERTTDTKKEVTIAFRGTWGFKDWVYGNAHWFTRFLPMDDQYSRARASVKKVFQHYADQTKEPPHYVTTGHSLGGGLAQHILYSNPKRVVQAITFDPSSVTGFADQTVDNQIAGCSCDASVTDGEPRIYRVYDAYEILSNLRIFHKIFFPPERHVQEVRFPNDRSHSMIGLTEYLSMNANSGEVQDVLWFQGIGELSPGVSCTSAFIERQKKSCSIQVSKDSWSNCPQ